MRRPSPIPPVVAVVLAFLATLPVYAHSPSTRTSCGALRPVIEADSANARVCQWIEAGELSDLRWPNFTAYREQVREFYAPSFALVWTSHGEIGRASCRERV